MIKLNVMKIFTRSTTNADALSICGTVANNKNNNNFRGASCFKIKILISRTMIDSASYKSTSQK